MCSSMLLLPLVALVTLGSAAEAKIDDTTVQSSSGAPQPLFSFELQQGSLLRATAAGKSVANILGRRGGWRSGATAVALVTAAGTGPWGGLNAKDFGAVGDGCEWCPRACLSTVGHCLRFSLFKIHTPSHTPIPTDACRRTHLHDVVHIDNNY